jgi:hypothetical protein
MTWKTPFLVKRSKLLQQVILNNESIFDDLNIIESSDEDNIQLKAEDKAFLKSIDKEKTKQEKPSLGT